MFQDGPVRQYFSFVRRHIEVLHRVIEQRIADSKLTRKQASLVRSELSEGAVVHVRVYFCGKRVYVTEGYSDSLDPRARGTNHRPRNLY